MELFIVPSSKALKYYENHDFAYKGDSGLDLFFVNNITIKAKQTLLVDLEISCEMKSMNKINSLNLYKNSSYLLLPRSSIYKTPLRLANSIGLIDSSYRGNIMVALDNTSDVDYNIKAGDKLFQLVAPNLEHFKLVITDKLSVTDRQDRGFGSSNVAYK